MKKRIEELEASILTVVRSVCEDDVQLHVFGSTMTGLAKPESDVDIYAQIGYNE